MEQAERLSAILAYLNLSDGSPSVAFQQNVNEFYRHAASERPDLLLRQALAESARRVAGQSAAFANLAQAEAVLSLTHDRLIPAYRDFHRDLLAHLSDADLLGPFFLVRLYEAVLAQHGSWHQADRIVAGSIARLNDYLGHRPIAVLEGKVRHEPYEHERLRPVPVYLRGAGVAVGRYQRLVAGALEILAQTDRELLFEVAWDADRMEELAIDPRAHDHGHPANRRPGYTYGEWDPHRLDRHGDFCRFIARSFLLESLLDWIGTENGDAAERAFDAAAALAGTMLLASGISGPNPHARSGELDLGRLVARVARARDRFYFDVLTRAPAARRERLEKEAARYRQPFGAVRQFLNHFVGRQQAEQASRERLSRLFARIGFQAASRRQTERILVPAARMRSAIRADLRQCLRAADQGDVASAIALLKSVRSALDRAIDCGALVDPWNILGFQGQYSLFPQPEHSVPDPRVPDLLELMSEIFSVGGTVAQAAAAAGTEEQFQEVEHLLRQWAGWWDRFATTAVAGIPRVSGQESVDAGLFVARALVEWRRHGRSADPYFWRRHQTEFSTPQACASVIDALLARGDLSSAMNLLMHWFHQSDDIPLEERDFSALSACRRWLARAMPGATDSAGFALVERFFDSLEANTEEWRRAPLIEEEDGEGTSQNRRDADDVFRAAYENMTFSDTALDGEEGTTMERGGTRPWEDEWSLLADSLAPRLRFLEMLADLWRSAALADVPPSHQGSWRERVEAWAREAQAERRSLARLRQWLAQRSVPEPSGSPESMLDFERQRTAREGLLHATISATIAMGHAERMLRAHARMPVDAQALTWEGPALEMERAFLTGDRDEVRSALARFLPLLSSVSLLYVPLDHGGNPSEVFECRYLRDVLRHWARRLPRRGLYRETFDLLRAALRAERARPSSARQVTEFNLLFPDGFEAVIRHLAQSLDRWSIREDDSKVTAVVAAVVGRFSRLWLAYVASVPLSEIERNLDQNDWDSTIDFIREHGRELFTQQFLGLGNVRAVLHDGPETFLRRVLEEETEPALPHLAHALQNGRSLERTARQLAFVLRVIERHYDVYLEYNRATTQSDYGDNLFLLLEQLRLLARYEQQEWALEPAYLAHRVLVGHGQLSAAGHLDEAFRRETAPAADQLEQSLRELEATQGMRLSSLSDRIAERFVRPLALHRIIAQVPLVRRELDRGDSDSSLPLGWEREVEAFHDSVGSVGPDLPRWIESLEEAIDASEEEGEAPAYGREDFSLTLEDFLQQMGDWSSRAD